MRAWPPFDRIAALTLALLPGAFVVVGAMVGATLGYRVNLTASMPMGVWREVTGDGARFVSFCLPAGGFARLVRGRGYVPHGMCPEHLAPPLKPILARAGDEVVVGPGGVRINGVTVVAGSVHTHDSQGLPIPVHPDALYRLRVDELWVMSPSQPRSLDSRYFGPIVAQNVVAYMEPVLVWDGERNDAGVTR